MAFNPQDRFVVTVGNKMIVTTQKATRSARRDRPRHRTGFPGEPGAAEPADTDADEVRCLDQSDEIRVLFGLNSEDDEPYAVVFAVDLMINSSTSVADRRDQLQGEPHRAARRRRRGRRQRCTPQHHLGSEHAPSPISSADNLIVLVAMMENDSSSPDQVRLTLETAARASLITNLPAFMATGAIPAITRQELVNRMIVGMAGAMGVAKVGFPDPDDNIGAIQELRFTQSELDDASTNFVNAEKSLTFEGDDAKYVTHFKVFREIGASLQPA